MARGAEESKHTKRQFKAVMDGRRKIFAKQKDAEESVIANTPSEPEI